MLVGEYKKMIRRWYRKMGRVLREGKGVSEVLRDGTFW